MCRNIIKTGLFWLLVMLLGCSGAPITASVGYYNSSTPGAQNVKGSYGQTVQSFVVEYDGEDVRHALKKAAGFSGMYFDVIKDNMLSGYANWVPPGFTGGCIPNQVFAAYIESAGKRLSKVTIVADHLSFCASATNSHLLVSQRLISNLNSVLATYD